MAIKDILNEIRAGVHSRTGHNIIVFLVFLAISTILWFVTALNDEGQADVRMKVEITHLPDSVTIVSRIPESVSVSLRTRGTQLLKLGLGHVPSLNIDFRQYHRGHYIHLSDPDIKSIARQQLDGATVTFISPDSINLAFTSQPPAILPVNPDYTVTPGPQAAIVGTPSLSADSVKVYTVGRLPQTLQAITTEPIRLNSINETVTRRVALLAPAHSRVIPDSIDVTFHVEPLILKTRKVTIEAINVPQGQKLITFPAQIEVLYMISLSDYKNSEPHLRVTADYSSIRHTPGSRMVRLRIAEASEFLQNVHLAADSAEYIIEHL